MSCSTASPSLSHPHVAIATGYFGVLAPNARPLVTAYAGLALPTELEPETAPPVHRAAGTGQAPARSPASYLWAALLARIYQCLPLVCARCGCEMRLIACVTEPTSAKPILEHLDLPTEPPVLAPARGPPHHHNDIDQTPLFDTTAPDPGLGFEFDQRVSW